MKDKEILGMMPNTMEVIKEVVLPRLKENTKEVENIAKELISFEKEVNKELDKIVAEISSVVSEHEQMVSSSADKTLSNEKDIQKVKDQLSKLSDSHVNSVAKLEQLISEAEAKIAVLSEDDESEDDTEEKELYNSVERLKIDLQRTKDEITSKLSSKENEERIIEISDVKGLLEVLQNISMNRSSNNTVQTSALNVFNSSLPFYQGVTKINFTGAILTRDGDTINVPVGGGGGGGGGNPVAETPTGLINDVNVTYTLSTTPDDPESVKIVLDGVMQYNGIDYTVSGTTVTFAVAPASGSTIFAYYNDNSGGGGGGGVADRYQAVTTLTSGDNVITHGLALSTSPYFVMVQILDSAGAVVVPNTIGTFTTNTVTVNLSAGVTNAQITIL